MRDVLVDCPDQLGHAGEDTATQALGGDVANEALHPVQPRGRGRREGRLKARVFGEAALHGRMLVGGAVVDDQMQCLVYGGLTVDLAQELQLLAVAVTLLALSNDLPVEQIESREQRGRTIALVVVGHGRGTALLHR